MRNAILVMALAMGALILPVTSDAAEKKAPASLIPTDELKWTDVPNMPGVQTSVVEGDGAKSAHHFFLKLPAGLEAPLHHHSTDHYGVLVKGTITLTVDGKETKLPAGSYFSFTNKTKHATKCDAASECIFFIDARKAWDVVMAPVAKK